MSTITIYQYDSNGYYRWETQHPANDPYLPNGTTKVKPEFIDGYWPRFNKETQQWEQVEDHRGEQGWVNGEPHVIQDYGPYPEGWSPNPPAWVDQQTIRSNYDAKLYRVRNGLIGAMALQNEVGINSMSALYSAVLGDYTLEIAGSTPVGQDTSTACDFCGGTMVNELLEFKAILRCPDCKNLTVLHN